MCCQNLVRGWLQSSLYQEKPMLSGSLIQSSTQYSIPLVTPSNTYMLLLEALVLSYMFWMQAAIFFCIHANTFPDTFLVGLLVMYSSLDNDNNSMSSMEAWNAYFCDNYVVNTISPLLWVSIIVIASTVIVLSWLNKGEKWAIVSW